MKLVKIYIDDNPTLLFIEVESFTYIKQLVSKNEDQFICLCALYFVLPIEVYMEACQGKGNLNPRMPLLYELVNKVLHCIKNPITIISLLSTQSQDFSCEILDQHTQC